MRYCPERSFPPYAFLPGENPHPTRDPEGHSYGADEGPRPYLPPDRWRDNSDYLFGVDLYNHGYLWEAHEAWEGIWHAARQDETQALHLQGLIQAAAGCLKIPMEQPRGLQRLGELGTEKLERVARLSGSPFMGLDLEDFVERYREFLRSEPQSIDLRPLLELEG